MRVRFLAAPARHAAHSTRVLTSVDRPPELAAQLAGKSRLRGRDRAHRIARSPHDADVARHSDARHRDSCQRLRNAGPGLYITTRSDGMDSSSAWRCHVMGLAFRYLPGWWAYAGGWRCWLRRLPGALRLFHSPRRVSVCHARAPWPGSPSSPRPLTTTWWCAATGASSRPRATRYQQAMQFVTHEMRTPLSAIQGSSELIIALCPHRGEAQADRRADQLRIQAPGPHGGSLPQRRAPLRRPDGAEARRLSASQSWSTSAWSASAPLAERKHIAITLEPIARRPAPHRRSRVDGVRLLQFTYQRRKILAPARPR